MCLFVWTVIEIAIGLVAQCVEMALPLVLLFRLPFRLFRLRALLIRCSHASYHARAPMCVGPHRLPICQQRHNDTTGNLLLFEPRRCRIHD